MASLAFVLVPLSSRWWLIIIARQITRTLAWSQNLCTASQPFCAELINCVRTGSCC